MSDNFVNVKYSGLDRNIRRMKLAEEAIEDPRLVPVVNAIADIWKVNFDTEGSLVGGWRPLSEMTQEVRRSRGFNPKHPILEQYGQLRYAAVEALSKTTSESLTVNADGAHMRYTSGKNRFELTISGRKVMNQFRNQSRKKGSAIFSAPPRRFWFVDNRVVDAARRALIEGIKKELRGAK